MDRGLKMSDMSQPLVQNNQPLLRTSVMNRANTVSASSAGFMAEIQSERTDLEQSALLQKHKQSPAAATYNTLALVAELLIDPFGIVSAVLAVVSVLVAVYYQDPAGNEKWQYKVSWTVASFFLIFPVTFAIGQAFTRREEANRNLAEIESLLVHTYIAHMQWDWGKEQRGRNRVPKAHTEGIKRLLISYADALSDTLILPPLCPTASADAPEQYSFEKQEHFRARHDVRERAKTRMMQITKKLSAGIELLKFHGLPANEASRINNYAQMIQTATNRLVLLKDFRTPQYVRAFVRVFICLMPVLYSPYYSDMHHHTMPMVYVLAFALFIQMAFVGLFNVQVGLEDAFIAGKDGIAITIWKQRLVRDLETLGEPVELEWDDRPRQ